MRVLASLVLIYGALLGASYVPAFVNVVPGLLTPGTTTTHIDVDNVSSPAAIDAAAKHGCRQIPFWIRPVANFPRTTRIVFEREGGTLGSALVRCKDLRVLRMSTPDDSPAIG